MSAKPKKPPPPVPATGHLELLYPNAYVKACDLHGGDVTVVIDRVMIEHLFCNGKTDRKVVLRLRSKSGRPLEKGWVVGSKTVLRQIGHVLGELDVSNWANGVVTMFPTTCRGASGGIVECIRVRGRVGGAATGDVPDDMAAPVEDGPRPQDFADEADAEDAPSPDADARRMRDIDAGQS